MDTLRFLPLRVGRFRTSPREAIGVDLRATSHLNFQAFFPALVLFFMTAALVITKTGRDGLYIEEGGVQNLPWAYLWMAAITPMAGMLFVAGIRAVGGRTMRLAGPLVVSAIQLLIPFVVDPDSGTLITALFVSVPVVFGVLLGAAWLLASEMRWGSDHDRARLYSAVGLGSLLGALAGAFVSRYLASRMEPQLLFAVGGVFLSLGALMIWITHMRFPQAAPGGKAGRPAGIRRLVIAAQDPQLQRLVAIAMPASMAGVFIEVLFYLAAPGEGAGEANSIFFANFYMISTGIAIAVSLAVPALQGRLGTNGSLMVLPVVLLGGTAFSLVALSSGAMLAGMRLAESGLKSSIYRSSWEQSYLTVDARGRQIAKLFVDGLGARMGEALGALLLLLGRALATNEVIWILGLLIPVVLVWVLTARRVLDGPDPAGQAVWSEKAFPRDCCVITTTLGKEVR